MAHATPFSDILAAAQHGSEWAWSRILADIGPGVQAYARSQGTEDPEDILSRVLEGLVRGIDRFRGNDTEFRSWAFTIAHSRVIDDRRRMARRPARSDRDVPDVADPASAADRASDALARADALDMLDGLPKQQRDIVALRVVAGLSTEETARVLNKRPGAIRVGMHRAMKTLEQENLAAGVTP